MKRSPLRGLTRTFCEGLKEAAPQIVSTRAASLRVRAVPPSRLSPSQYRWAVPQPFRYAPETQEKNMKQNPLRGLTLTLRNHASTTGGEGLQEAAPSRVEDAPSPWVLLPSWASF